MQSAANPQTTQMESETTSIADDILFFFRALVNVSHSTAAHAEMAKKIQQYYLNFLNLINQNNSNPFKHNKKILLANLSWLKEHTDSLKDIPQPILDKVKNDIEANGAALLQSLGQSEDLNELVDSLVELRNLPSPDLVPQGVVTSPSIYPFYTHLVYIHISPQASVEKMLADSQDCYNQQNWFGAISCLENAKEIVEESKPEDFDNYNYYLEKIHYELTDAYYRLGKVGACSLAVETPDCMSKSISLAEENGCMEKSCYTDIWISAHIKLGEYFYNLGIVYQETITTQALKFMEKSLFHMETIITRYPTLKADIVASFNPAIQCAINCARKIYNEDKDFLLRIDLSNQLIALFELDSTTDHTRDIHSNRQFLILNMLMVSDLNPNISIDDKLKVIDRAIENHLQHQLHQFNNESEPGYHYQFLMILFSHICTLHQKLELGTLMRLMENIDNLVMQVDIVHQMYDVKLKHTSLLKCMAYQMNNLVGTSIFTICNVQFVAAAAIIYEFLQNIPQKFDAQFLSPVEKLIFQKYQLVGAAMKIRAHFLSANPTNIKNIREVLEGVRTILYVQPASTDYLNDYYQLRANIATDLYVYSSRIAENPANYRTAIEYLDIASQILLEIPIAMKTSSMQAMLQQCEIQLDFLNAEILINTTLHAVDIKKIVESLEEITDRLEQNFTVTSPLYQWYIAAINLKFDLLTEQTAKLCDQHIHELRDKLLIKPHFFSTKARQQEVNLRLLSFYHNQAAPMLHDKSEARLLATLSALDSTIWQKGFRHVKSLKKIKNAINDLIFLGCKFTKQKPAPRPRSNSI